MKAKINVPDDNVNNEPILGPVRRQKLQKPTYAEIVKENYTYGQE